MKNFLKKVLPWIGAAATGNVPALITMAAKTVGDAVGKEIKPDMDAIAAAVSGATPEQLLALKQADNDFMLKMQAMGFEHLEDMEKIAADDRASARNREIQVKDWMPKALGLGALAVFTTCMFLLIFYELPQTAKEVVVYMLGILSGMVKDVYGYFFGSSSSSKNKDEALANIAQME
jgi:hypothetical protein